MSDRGMKKWAPYSSLVEQATCLEEMKYNRNRIEKPLISQDQAEKINDILSNYQKGQLVKIKFFNNGFLYEIISSIKRIDIDNKQLILEEGKLELSKIIDMDNLDSF